jgi:hypothetical protein
MFTLMVRQNSLVHQRTPLLKQKTVLKIASFQREILKPLHPEHVCLELHLKVAAEQVSTNLAVLATNYIATTNYEMFVHHNKPVTQ